MREAEKVCTHFGTCDMHLWYHQLQIFPLPSVNNAPASLFTGTYSANQCDFLVWDAVAN
jgi:hypothetical protein